MSKAVPIWKISVPFKDKTRRRPMLKELQEKNYAFPDLGLLGMLKDLLEKKDHSTFRVKDQKRLGG